MDQQTARDILSGRKRGVGASLLRGALYAASKPYAGAMRLRRWAYGCGLMKSRAAGVPVICVGNITTGGTGKTPMVAWTVARLKDASRTPAVLTRGYKAGGGRCDEAELLERLCGVRVVVNPDRPAGAQQAVAAGADVLVMDDGFQHRRLRRDLDIVLIDATCPFGFGHCLPRGLLREPPSALKSAHAVVITRSDLADAGELRALRARLGRLSPAASIHLAVHRPAKLIAPDGEAREPDALAGEEAFAFCGLGNPEAFFETLERLGAALRGRCALDDHVRYDPATVAALSERARSAGAKGMVTTAKDAVKIDASAFPLPLWQVVVEIDVVKGADELTRHIRAAAGVL